MLYIRSLQFHKILAALIMRCEHIITTQAFGDSTSIDLNTLIGLPIGIKETYATTILLEDDISIRAIFHA
jgi:hypothetical protein